MGVKEAIQSYGREITASFSCGGVRYKDEQIVSMNPHYEGSLLKTVMKCLDIELDGDLLENPSAIAGIAISGEAVAGVIEATDRNTIKCPLLGVKAPTDSDYYYIEYGTYIVKESVKDEEKHSISLECYDLMLLSMVPYDLTIDYSTGVTVKNYLDAICDRLGWKKGYSSFYNSAVLLDGEKYSSGDTFRDVLDDIAEVAGGMIGFVGDELRIIYPTDNGQVIDEENLKSLKIGKKYGPVNSVVLSRAPQEDNIYNQDNSSIEEHGLTEIRIENNQIIDSHREDFMAGICDALFGLSFELYDLESFGIGYLSFGELFTLQTADGTLHKALMLCDDLTITQGVSESSYLEEPAATTTDYASASTTDKVLNKTILKVDKQAQEITAIVSKTNNIGSTVDGIAAQVTHLTEVMIDYDSVDIKISTAIGEIDSITTSTGYTFDQDGLHINKSGEAMENLLDNTGMYVNRGGDNILTANNDGVDAINLRSRQYLIIGNNSRIENYGYGRTACFFIGGS